MMNVNVLMENPPCTPLFLRGGITRKICLKQASDVRYQALVSMNSYQLPTLVSGYQALASMNSYQLLTSVSGYQVLALMISYQLSTLVIGYQVLISMIGYHVWVSVTCYQVSRSVLNLKSGHLSFQCNKISRVIPPLRKRGVQGGFSIKIPSIKKYNSTGGTQ